MVYSNKFVMAVLINGRPTQELASGEVQIPFGEYSLRFRNKHNRRAVVKIFVDGENVSGGGYVIQPHSHVDIKRHHDIDRAFKFVTLDSPDAVDHGKNGPNPDKVKGTIEAHFYLEKNTPQPIYRPIVHEHIHHYPRRRSAPHPQPYWVGDNPPVYGSVTCGVQPVEISTVQNSADLDQFLNLQEGCTVEGNYTGQQFYTTHLDLEDSYTTLRIFLKGYHKNVETVPEIKRTNKDQYLDELEVENEKLRRKLAELENEKLKAKIKELES